MSVQAPHGGRFGVITNVFGTTHGHVFSHSTITARYAVLASVVRHSEGGPRPARSCGLTNVAVGLFGALLRLLPVSLTKTGPLDDFRFSTRDRMVVVSGRCGRAVDLGRGSEAEAVGTDVSLPAETKPLALRASVRGEVKAVKRDIGCGSLCKGRPEPRKVVLERGVGASLYRCDLLTRSPKGDCAEGRPKVTDNEHSLLCQ